MKEPQRIFRKDYCPLPYKVIKTDLEFDLDPLKTRVTSLLYIETERSLTKLELDGEALTLLSVALDGVVLTKEQFSIEQSKLILTGSFPSSFVLKIVTEINPSENLKLMGLYRSGNILCTQMEAEGFRRVTYYPDRPDMLSRFTTKVIANRHEYPILLSNGNPVDMGLLEGDKHFVTWEDPYPKPCYLFALVAGELGMIEDSFKTCSGRTVKLQVYVDKGNEGRAHHAMASLKKAMKWDEDTFGLEYDLELYMIVAVDAFNFGAMENKGLNIFNSSAVLADQHSATDKDYQRIEGIVAHEYFHNWTGNRVTCRDWFQLTLKEGLTVFRDQEFSADMHSAPVFRINDVRVLREGQFTEDSGPNAHPIRPDSYIEINNFYTQTVYEKGAEVIRMIHMMLGKEGFRKGMNLYFERHDGQAVCTDNFVAAMSDANNVNLKAFAAAWYAQKGTPQVEASWTCQDGIMKVNFTQKVPKQTDGSELYYVIPVKFSILDGKGSNVDFEYKGRSDSELVLELTAREQNFEFKNCPKDALPSFFRQFSAPIKFKLKEDKSHLLKRLQIETDPFNAYEAGQILLINEILRCSENPKLEPPSSLIDAFLALLERTDLDDAMKAEMLSFPSLSYILEVAPSYNPKLYHDGLHKLKYNLAVKGKEKFILLYQTLHAEEKGLINTLAMGRRALKNKCLFFLSLLNDAFCDSLIEAQFEHAQTMTDRMAALGCLVDGPKSITAKVLRAFEQVWHKDSVVMNKWFAIQASSERVDLIEHLNGLIQHASFDAKNPNKLRSLYGTFMKNLIHFHDLSGNGYIWMADKIIEVDQFNSGVAASLSRGFSRLAKLPSELQIKMRAQIERVLAEKSISPDTFEILNQTLATIRS